MFRPYMSGTSVLCRLRPTVTPFLVWTALPPAEYYEVIRLPEGHRPRSLWLPWPTDLRCHSRLGSGLPCVCRGFPHCVAQYPYPVPEFSCKLEPTGSPTVLTLLSPHPTLYGGPRQTLGTLTQSRPRCWLLGR